MPKTSEPWAGSVNRPDTIYVVKTGDSLSKIALTFYNNATAFARIATANNIDPAKPIQVGQRLVIPGGGSNDPQGAEDSPALVARKEVTPVATQVVKPGFTAVSLSDWRVWAGVGLVGLAIYLLTRKNR